MNPFFRSEVRRWDVDALCEYEERAAIMEYEGKIQRAVAESFAYTIAKPHAQVSVAVRAMVMQKSSADKAPF
jgi:hypothetical protein